MKGGTTFNFVTDGIESALEQARAAAGDKDVSLGGGASIAQQYLKAGLIDEMHVHAGPDLPRRRRAAVRQPRGRGDPARVHPRIEAPGVTHLTYRVVH